MEKLYVKIFISILSNFHGRSLLPARPHLWQMTRSPIHSCVSHRGAIKEHHLASILGMRFRYSQRAIHTRYTYIHTYICSPILATNSPIKRNRKSLPRARLTISTIRNVSKCRSKVIHPSIVSPRETGKSVFRECRRSKKSRAHISQQLQFITRKSFWISATLCICIDIWCASRVVRIVDAATRKGARIAIWALINNKYLKVTIALIFRLCRLQKKQQQWMDENKIYLMHHPIYRWDSVSFVCCISLLSSLSLSLSCGESILFMLFFQNNFLLLIVQNKTFN